MRKIKRCKVCDAQIDVGIKCDTCGKVLIYPIVTLDICDELYDFCCLTCLLKFTTAELKKINPRTNIEFGKEK